MGLKSRSGLKAFCAELAEAEPSPGGGTAAAGAGAMAASLLAMVCGVTAKNRKYARSADELARLRKELIALQTRLIENARLDAEAYDAVVAASKRRRERPGANTDAVYESALKRATEVPMATAEACACVLEAGIDVAELGSRAAWSDVGTALVLADAGFEGAIMNVRINLDTAHGGSDARSAEARLERLTERRRKGLSEAMKRLRSKKH